MEGIATADASEIGEVFTHLGIPLLQVRWAEGFLRRAGKDNVGHLEVALGAAVGRGLFIDRLCHEQRGLTHLEGGAIVSADRRIDLVVVEDGGVVTDVGRVLVAIRVAAEEQGDDDEGIFLGDQAAAGLHVFDFQVELADGGAQVGVALGGEPLDGVFFLGLLQSLFPSGEKWIGGLRAFGPAIAGEGLVVIGHPDVVIECRHAISVRAIGHHVHLGLDQQGAALAGRVCEFEDGLAVEEVVPVQRLVEARDVPFHRVGLVLVKFVVEAGHLARLHHRLQVGQHCGEVLVDAGELTDALVGFGYADGELELGLVRLGVEPFQTGEGSLLGDQGAVDGDAVEQRRHIHLFARNVFLGEGRWRSGDFFDDLDLTDDFFDDLLGHLDLPENLLGDDFGIPLSGGTDDVLDAALDPSCIRREGQEERQTDDREEENAGHGTETPGSGFLFDVLGRGGGSDGIRIAHANGFQEDFAYLRRRIRRIKGRGNNRKIVAQNRTARPGNTHAFPARSAPSASRTTWLGGIRRKPWPSRSASSPVGRLAVALNLVGVGPGQTQVTTMFLGASSTAMASDRLLTNAFDAP